MQQLPQQISPAGRAAAYVTAMCFVVAGIAYVIASWDEVRCNPVTDSCDIVAAAGALISILALVAVAIGVAILWTVRRRPVSPNGGSGWTWGLGALFAAGLVAIAGVLPPWSCPAGVHLDATFGLCIEKASRFQATSLLWAKWLLFVIGIALGVTVMRLPRWVVVTAPIAALAWFLGFGWLLVDTVGRGLTPY